MGFCKFPANGAVLIVQCWISSLYRILSEHSYWVCCAISFICRIQKVAMARLSTTSVSVKAQKSLLLGRFVPVILFSLESMLWRIRGKVSFYV